MITSFSVSRYKKIMIGLVVLALVSLGCDLSDSESDIQATSDSLASTSAAISAQTTQQAATSNTPVTQVTQPPPPPSQQKTPPPIPKPPTSQPTQGEPPGHPTQQSPPPQNDSGIGDFHIENQNTSSSICYFYMDPSSEPEWSTDRLGSDTIIYPGESFTLTGIPYGTYDAIALDCDDSILGEVYGFDFPPNDTFTLYDSTGEPLCGDGVCGDFENSGNCPQDCGTGSEVILTLINQTSEPVCFVWIGPPQSEWLYDLLGDDIIDGWGTFAVYIPVGEWALQAEDCSGTEYSVMKYEPYITISGDTTWYIDP